MGDKGPTVHARALQRAADILGGKEPLRAVLRVPMIRLDEWLEGHSEPPMDIFLKAVDLISTPVQNAPPAAATRARVLAQQSAERIRRSQRTLESSHERVVRFLQQPFDQESRSAMLESALDAAIEATHAQKGNVQLKTAEGLRIVAQRGFSARFLEFFACVTTAHCACGTALSAGARVIVNDVSSDPIFVGTEALQVMQGAGARAVQSTPIVATSGEVLGMVSTHYELPGIPPAADLEAIDRIAERTAYWLEHTTA
jgi:GAF domain-containing protein